MESNINIIGSQVSPASSRRKLSRDIPDVPRDLPSCKDSVSLSPKVTERDEKKIKVRVLPQDPVVSGPETIDFPQEKIGTNVSGKRVVMEDKNNPKAIPDLEGNYFYDVGTPQFDQVNAHTTAYRTLDMYQGYLGRDIPWAFNNEKLRVLPHKQEGQNAYYSRWDESVNFFYFKSKPLAKTVQTSESADVVSHETGHAILDGMRPEYFNWDEETMAFHEAAGDVSAMLFALQDENNLKMVLEQNQGDFRRESLITRLGEEFGKAIHLENTDPSDDDKLYLRSALNKFSYVPPDSLPDKGNEDTLTSEPHNFSRLFTASFYDVLEGIYQRNAQNSTAEKTDALRRACDTLGRIFAKAIDLAPVSRAKYKDIALAMIKADKGLYGGANTDILKQVFLDRKIIPPQDLNTLESQEAALPQIILEKKIENSAQANEFLEKYKDSLGAPKGASLNLQSMHTTRGGEQNLSFVYSKEIKLSGSQFGSYDGYYADVFGGVTLEFDSGGKLRNVTMDEITPEKEQEAMAGIRRAIDAGLVTEKVGAGNIFKNKNDIFQGIVIPGERGKKKIVRIPMIA